MYAHTHAPVMNGNETKPTLTIDSWWMIPSATLHGELARGSPGDWEEERGESAKWATFTQQAARQIYNRYIDMQG